MRRAVSIALFALLAFLPLQAQRGARGGGSGGFRGGASFHGGGGVYRGGGAVAFRGGTGGTYHAVAPRYPIRTQVPNGGNYGHGYGWGGYNYHHHYYYGYYGYPGYYYPYYGYAYGYPYAYSAYPFYDLGFYSDYSNNTDQTNAYADQLSNQVNSLSAEMQQLRDENDNLRDYIAEHNAPPAYPDRSVPPSVSGPLQPQQPVAQRQPEKPSIPTLLVFKDGHTMDAPNYAIVGSTVWVLTGQRATKVPLSELDLQKTQDVNEKRGVEFTAPTSE